MTTTPADARPKQRSTGTAADVVPPLRELAALIGHADPRTRYRGLALLAERAKEPPLSPGEAAELAGLLPRAVPEAPDESLLLAGLHQRLGVHLPRRRLSAWRTVRLPQQVRIAWLRAELVTHPAALRDEPPGELLRQAVRSIDAGSAHRPDRLVAELLATRDPFLRTEAVRLVREGLHAALLAPGLAREHLAGLLDEDPDTTGAASAAALEELAEPWAASDPLPESRFAPYLDPVHAAPSGALALTAAARHGHGTLLSRTAADPAVPPALRRLALELLGDLAERGDIGALLDIAAQDPLLLAGPSVTCLQGLHRRGHFPEAAQAPALVGLALADHSVDLRTVATILYTSRRTVLDLLADAPADDPGTPRRLALLVALAGQGTGDLPVGEAVTRLLPSARLPGPFLGALRELRYEGAEEAVLALLPRAPAAALDTLEAIGGRRTVTVLTEALGREPDGSGIAPFLRPVRHQALELLWRLTTDPELRRHLLARVDPTAPPPAVTADLGAPDERELALLAATPVHADPVAALCTLAAHGSAATLPAVTALLLRIVSELAASWEAVETGPRPEQGRAEEPVVPEEIVDAVRALGGRLYERRRIRPSCLLGARDARAAGDALVAGLVLDLLDRPGLPSRQQSVLLEVLRRAPSAQTRPRVHRLLRHRDPHVRKQVIALLATGASGEDAQALSATLITLTRSDDILTVRQALLALGRAEARWACPAITVLLDHPTMNIRKTAAAVLLRAGTPAAVPGLLRVLGRHDNPGLRAGIVDALRAVLGEACTATLLAAAAHCRVPRERTLLLRGLHGVLSSRTVRALADQGSPLVPELLALVADGRIGLGAGSVGELAGLWAGHGITASAHPAPADEADLLVDALAGHGWSARIALRLAESPEVLRNGRLQDLSPMLAEWLGLAGSVPDATRDRVLGIVLRLRGPHWSAGELEHLKGSAQVLTEALAGEEENRPGLLSVLEAVAPRLPGSGRMAAAEAVRAMSPPPHLPALRLLRACGVVTVRDDLERALAGARLDADDRGAEAAVLREVFGLPVPLAPGGGAAAWRSALHTALRTRPAVAEFRRGGDPCPPDSRQRLAALMAAWPDAGDDGVRALLLDWMTDLQPLGVPPWTLAETTGPASEVVHEPDRTRSVTRRARLLEMLDAPDPARRTAAARQLQDWPEPEAARAVLDAYLRGRVPLPSGGRPARTLVTVDPTDLDADGILPARVARLARELGPWDLVPLIPLLLGWWENGPAGLRAEAGHALRPAPAEVLADHLRARLEAGAWGFLDLLAGRRLLSSPELVRIRERLRAEGRGDLAEALLLDGGAVSLPAPAAPVTAVHRPGRAELLLLARTGGPEQIRRALVRLAEEHGGRAPDRDPALKEVIGELLTHPRPKVRLHAHRISRTMLDRTSHLLHTADLLDDPQPDIRRMAIRTLSHAAWEPAVPALVALLDHPQQPVRAEAAEGLLRMGGAAVPALRRAVGHARPDRRARYTGVLDRLTGAGGAPPA